MSNIKAGYLIPDLDEKSYIDNFKNTSTRNCLINLENLENLERKIKDYNFDTIVFLNGDPISIKDKVEIYSGNGSCPSTDYEVLEALNEIGLRRNLSLKKKTYKKNNFSSAKVEDRLRKTMDFKSIHISLSGSNPNMFYDLGISIKEATKNLDKVVLLIGLSNISDSVAEEDYLDYNPYGRIYSREIIRLLKEKNLLGIGSISEDIIKKGQGNAHGVLVTILSSIREDLDKINVLSYGEERGKCIGVIEFSIFTWKDILEDGKLSRIEKYNLVNTRSKESIYVRLARLSLEYYIMEGKIFNPTMFFIDEGLSCDSSAFVSIYIRGKLRGCVGTMEKKSHRLLADIVENAIKAGVKDLRFPMVDVEELPYLTYIVDIVSKPIEITEENIGLLNHGEHGIIVVYKGRRTLVLPRVNKTNSIEEQIQLAKKNAGIQENSKYSLEYINIKTYH